MVIKSKIYDKAEATTVQLRYQAQAKHIKWLMKEEDVDFDMNTDYYIDYEDQRVKDFLLKYRALFNTEPSQFAFQGYDSASYFINLCNRYGDRWTEMVDNAPQAMLQSTFRCKKIDENGGYINNGIRRIIYDDGWSVYELK